jgi:K+-sensing histidine kinase KdpD
MGNTLLKGGIHMEEKNILVCVTQQKTCKRLILNGYNMIENKEDKLYVIHVVNEKEKFLNKENDGEALEYLFCASKEVGADLTVLRSKNIISTMIDFAKEHNITRIVMGSSVNQETEGQESIRYKLKESLCDVEFVIL